VKLVPAGKFPLLRSIIVPRAVALASAAILLSSIVAAQVLPAAREAGTKSLECRWAPGVYHLGDPVQLEVKIPLRSEDFFLTGEPAAGDEWGPARVIRAERKIPEHFPGTLAMTYTLQVFDVGPVTLPPADVSVHFSKTAVPYEIKPPGLQIQPLLKGPAKAPPPPAAPLPFPAPSPWLLYFAAALLAVGAGASILIWARRKRKPLRALPQKPSLRQTDPDAWFQEELKRIFGMEAPADSRYAALSRVLREYLCIKTGLPFPDWTTHEASRALYRVQRLEGEAGHSLLRALSLCDTIKFARHQPTDLENSEARHDFETVARSLSAPPPEKESEAS
jgi:hypothetical protein